MTPQANIQPSTPSTPPRRSARLAGAVGLSPPASPATTHRAADDHLESSYLFINESEETSSEIGSSLRDSVIGDLSDSSSEAPIGREGWEDDDFTLSTGRQSEEQGELVQIDDDLGPEGSYIDAEATASDLGGSRSTIQRHLQELSDSQVRLIMPDPGSSFTTSATVSDNTTPSGSLGNLLSTVERADYDGKPTPMRRDTASTLRPIDKSWLEASSRLWNVPTDLKSALVFETEEKGDYQLLASIEDVQESGSSRQSGCYRAVGQDERPRRIN